MSDKIFYKYLAKLTVERITRSPEDWTEFLKLSARMYKYRFIDQMMIYAQKPDATACAEYDLWNQRMHRFVKKGSKGIALFSKESTNPHMRYVFDISDTGAMQNAVDVTLWKVMNEHTETVKSALQSVIGEASSGDEEDTFQLISEASESVFAEYQDASEHRLNELNIGEMITKNLVEKSVSYIVEERLYADADQKIPASEFAEITALNSIDNLPRLGVAVNDISAYVLRTIEKAVKHYDLQKRLERKEENDRTNNRDNVSQGRGLSDSKHRTVGNGSEATGQIRTDEESVSDGEQSGRIRMLGSEGRVISAPVGDRRDSEPSVRSANEAVSAAESSAGQSQGSDGLGETHEHAEGTSGRSDQSGTDRTVEVLSLFPTGEEGENPSFLIGDTEITQVLRIGSGIVDGKLRIAAMYHNAMDAKDRVEFLKNEYGIGGGTIAFGNGSHGMYDSDAKGITISVFGYDDAEHSRRLTWSEVNRRLESLVMHGKYLTDDEEKKYDALREMYGGTIPMPKPRYGFPPVPESTEETEEQQTELTKEETEAPVQEPETAESEEQSDTEEQAVIDFPAENFRITDEHLGEGTAKEKFRANMDAIHVLQTVESEKRNATPEEQETLSHYVGWGGLPDAFDESKSAWSSEYAELKNALSDEEYADARASTLNAHYTSPVVIKAIFDAVGQIGFQKGNILEPSMGIGNFFGMMPEEMAESSHLYGVELDSISGRIAQKLYPKADIKVEGFQNTSVRDFYDIAVGNVPFGNYRVPDKAYDKYGFAIHNYFFAKTLDEVRPGGIIAFVTSRFTMDSKNQSARKYIAQRAKFLGAIRLPNTAFKANAGTDVVSDIIFLQKRDHPEDVEPDWIYLGQNDAGFTLNQYFIDHPEMILGQLSTESTQYGKDDLTVNPVDGADLSDLLHTAVQNITGTYEEAQIDDLNEEIAAENNVIPAEPDIDNYSYGVVDDRVYYRENSVMRLVEGSDAMLARTKAMVNIRNTMKQLIDYQLNDYPEAEITAKQRQLNTLYDTFSKKYGLLNSNTSARAFDQDSSYYLLCSLEEIDEDGRLKQKADIFFRRTILPYHTVTSVETPTEALAVSIGEKGRVDLPYMAELIGTPGQYDKIKNELKGVIFKNPQSDPEDDTVGWQTADEYLSGNVREKLRIAEEAAEYRPELAVNVESLKEAQPKDLTAAEIEVHLGATWIPKDDIEEFMYDTFETPYFYRDLINVSYAPMTAEWSISGKNLIYKTDISTYSTWGTQRASAYKILEDTLNLKDIRIFDTIEEDGKEKRVLNKRETMLAQQKQQKIKDAFTNWVWESPERRNRLTETYNNLFNSIRPREYDGSHINFVGMNPDIQLREHQRNAIAHILYGKNTLLAHEVGAGKTFEMAAAAMELKRLGLCHKSLFVVPNHLTLQWASEFLRLYPNAKLLVASKKDFQTANRKKFCARIATGDYDAVIIGHSQFEKIPLSAERQKKMINRQIEELQDAIAAAKLREGDRFTIKQMEKTRKSLEGRLEKLNNAVQKDDVITFEQLGVDRLFVDEAHAFKNLFLYTKMRNVAGISTSEAAKSTDMFNKCQYMDEITGGRGVVFATGTPVSNSMTELYTMMRYLQYDTLNEKNLQLFDAWASTFGETTTSIELAPEGTGYRARTRFAKFYNLPELMSIFKEVADIKTADQLHLPVPDVESKTVVVEPSEIQQEMVKSLSERATKVHNGSVDPSEDNMLKITSDGRKIGLDQRLMNDALPDDPNSKVNACVKNVLQIWKDGAENRLTQLIFCDMSTPKPGTFNVYDDIKEKLIVSGVPESEIAFIHDAGTEEKKKALFAKVRAGEVRILFGSTQKMGAGTNVQDRLIAVHHLDVGWRPADMTQRNGRIVRQGNMNPKVYIYQYVTSGTFDAYLWQTLETKQKYISQIMTSKAPVRSCEDMDEQVLNFAEVKALCENNPLIKEKMDLDIQVSKLKVLKANYKNEQYMLQDKILRYYPEKIQQQKNIISGYQKDIQTAEQHPQGKDGFVGMTVNNKFYEKREDAGQAILSACKHFTGLLTKNIGSYRGFNIELTYDSFENKFRAGLRGERLHAAVLGDSASGNITRLDNVIDGIPDELTVAKAMLEDFQRQEKASKEALGKPFEQEEELKQKNDRLEELNALLNVDEKPENVQTDDIVEGDGQTSEEHQGNNEYNYMGM